MSFVKKTDTYEVLINEAQRLDIVIFLTPVPKGRPRFARGIVYTPTKTKRFESQLKKVLKEVRKDFPLMRGPVGMTLSFFSKAPRKTLKGVAWKTTRPDVDNLIKAVADSMNGILYEDDAQITQINASKLFCYPGETPRICIYMGALVNQDNFKAKSES
jgi:Holliday junction resolvase RusA-like endonuclease